MNTSIAIVGLACRYADADGPTQLWENILAKRLAFRRIPDTRLNLNDYFDADRSALDKTYSTRAAVLTGWHFDRVRFRIAGSTFRRTDLAHWLALQVASEALADAGFPDGEGLPREGTGVLVGNTLTGEFSRAQILRLRWPYVRRVLAETLKAGGASSDMSKSLIESMGERFRAPFPEVDEDTLAGGLSNTIAGRICNTFDLNGGGYTLDGACSSSLLAVANACSGLVAGDLDAALVGGVDLSIDPFEILGFAKAGALASKDMRVYDAKATGFVPGEGSGFAVLMREADAIASGRRIYASIRGWGLSSDGSGGITRPEVAGQRLALARAYRRAGYGPETVGYFEGHGTGTALGDATELRTLLGALSDAGPKPEYRPVLGSIKALIGHTKAASGIAGLIKATLAVHNRILPPMAGQKERHPLLVEANLIQTPHQAAPWPLNVPLRASTSAMGFGGINAHITLEAVGAPPRRARRLRGEERVFRGSAQDAELFVFDGEDRQRLRNQIQPLLAYVNNLSLAELGDLAAELSRQEGGRRHRAAVVASSPEAFLRGLNKALEYLDEEVDCAIDIRMGVFLGLREGPARVGFLFPGQGSPANLSGGIWRQRFEAVADIYDRAELPTGGDGVNTAVAQPAIVTASMAAVAVLEDLGLQGDVAVGHSLGEFSALAWAGTFSEEGLLRTARVRGQAMADLGDPTGSMLSIQAGSQEVETLLTMSEVSVACYNSPEHTVVSGPSDCIEKAAACAEGAGMKATRLSVSHAFHSPLVADSVPVLKIHLDSEQLQSPSVPVISTVTGELLKEGSPIAELLARQVVEPVRFVQAITQAAELVDLFIELGPGQALSALVAKTLDKPVISLNSGGDSLGGLMRAVAAVWASGGRVRHQNLFSDRFFRPFQLNFELDTLVNPCEQLVGSPPDTVASDVLNTLVGNFVEDLAREGNPSPEATTAPAPPDSPQDLVRALVARRVELPVDAVGLGDRFLSDLHLNSIMVGEIAGEAARMLGAPQLRSPTDYADAEVGQLAEALQELIRTGGERPESEAETSPAGVASWVRPFAVQHIQEDLLPIVESASTSGDWRVVAPSNEPLRLAIEQASSRLSGHGVILCLPARPDMSHVQMALAEAKMLARKKGDASYVLVQSGYGAGGIARTLHLEFPRIDVCVLDIPAELPGIVDFIIEEARSVHGFVEASYDAEGARRVPRLRLWTPEGDGSPPLGPEDVILITGGGKGITAECALEISRWTGAALAILGRSDPSGDEVLRANLDRIQSAGGRVSYYSADVTDEGEVRDAVAAATAELGPITAVLHGAGRNVPELLMGLDDSSLQATFSPKVEGLRHVLSAIDADRLRLLVSFGSIIGRSGMRGNADYAVANEWLRAETERWVSKHSTCRALVLEWSVWAGVGMGARLSAVDALAREGITAIPVDEGVSWMRRLLSHPTPTSVVVTGRYGGLPTLRMEPASVPFLRFLDNVRTLTPGVEIVADSSLSVSSDPYLEDHVFKGQRLVPAVLGFEAMAQAARALTGKSTAPSFEQVVFTRPIVVPADGELCMRVGALVNSDGTVQAVVRAEDSDFLVDCFRATLSYDPPKAAPLSQPKPGEDLPIDVVGDLYGSLLFHEGRFRRVEAYSQIRGRGCVGRIGIPSGQNWFATHLPSQLILGDPGLQDAAIHVHQAAVPHSPLLPRGVGKVIFGDVKRAGPWWVQTRETSRTEQSIIVDVELRTMDGHLRESWKGLELAMVAGTEYGGPWPEPVLGSYLEHQIERLHPFGHVEATVFMHGTREKRKELAAAELLGANSTLYRRPDGKPMLNGETEVSFSHTDDLCLAVAAETQVACDLEPITPRGLDGWRDQLSPERMALAEMLMREGDEDLDASATRVWTANECLRKAGVAAGAPLTLREPFDNGWAVLGSGKLIVLTGVLSTRRSDLPLAVAVAIAQEN